MPVDLTVIDASAFSFDRARRLMEAGIARSIRLQVAGNTPAVIATNRSAFPKWRRELGEVWASWRAGEDLEADLELVAWARAELRPAGWCPNVERWAEGRDLRPLARILAGERVVWNLGGYPLPERAGLDYQAMVSVPGAHVEWQCYVGTGEGPAPRAALESFVRPQVLWAAGGGRAWHYRALVGSVGARRWTWLAGEGYREGRFWLRGDARYGVAAQVVEGGVVVATDRGLVDESGRPMGYLYGFVPYARTRVCLWHRGLSEGEVVALASAARLPRCAGRPVALFAPETAPDSLIARVASVAS